MCYWVWRAWAVFSVLCPCCSGRRPCWAGLPAILRRLWLWGASGALAEFNPFLHPGQRDQLVENCGEVGSVHHGSSQKGGQKHNSKRCFDSTSTRKMLFLKTHDRKHERNVAFITVLKSLRLQYIYIFFYRCREFTPRRGWTPRKWKRKWWILLDSSGLCFFLGFMKPLSFQVLILSLFRHASHLDTPNQMHHVVYKGVQWAQTRRHPYSTIPQIFIITQQWTQQPNRSNNMQLCGHSSIDVKAANFLSYCISVLIMKAQGILNYITGSSAWKTGPHVWSNHLITSIEHT